MIPNSRISALIKLPSLLACIALSASCTNPQTAGTLAPVPEIRPGYLQGYLPHEALPNSLALVPAPPTEGSAAFALDHGVSQAGLALRGTARWELATSDANLRFPEAAGTFSCALNAPVSERDTPHLYQLLRRSLTDAGLATYSAKNHYQRARPFMANQEPTCTPQDELLLRKDGSYPSGHTAIGWAWALILSEVSPAQADAIIARGRAFGQSRMICNVHWQSDVIEGRLVGAATVARLHADPAFRADLEAAKAEIAAVHSRGLQPQRDCEAEAAALAEVPPSAPWPANK